MIVMPTATAARTMTKQMMPNARRSQAARTGAPVPGSVPPAMTVSRTPMANKAGRLIPRTRLTTVTFHAA